ncbi:MAG: hypothetical protein FWF55_01495 [Treponema sp.]|nr:hypothetical protein [Treponema sp.]
MKNRVVFLIGLCLVLAWGLVFTACDDGSAQLIQFETSKIAAPKNVTAALASYNNSMYLEVKWDGSGVSRYEIFLTQDGKTTWVWIGYVEGFNGIVKDSDGVINDVDKWYWRSNISSLPKGTFRVVVQASTYNTTNANSLGDIKKQSDGVWAPGTITIQ